MANTSTQGTPIALTLGDPFGGSKAIPIRVNYDTPLADLTLYAPDKQSRAYVVGLTEVTEADHVLTLKSGSATIAAPSFGAFSGLHHPFCVAAPSILVETEPGAALVMNCNRTLQPFTLYVVEAL